MKNNLSAVDSLSVEDNPSAAEVPPTYRSYVTINPTLRLE